MTCKHLFTATMLVLCLSAGPLISQTITGTTIYNPIGQPTDGVSFFLEGKDCDPADPCVLNPWCSPPGQCSTAFFILFGDGQYAIGEGTELTRYHKYAASGTFQAKAFFAEKKKDIEPPLAFTNVIAGSAAGPYPTILCGVSGSVNVGTSWIPVAGKKHFIILTITNNGTSPMPGGTLDFYYNATQVSFADSDIAEYNAYPPAPAPPYFLAIGGPISTGSLNIKKRKWSYPSLPPLTQRHLFLYALVNPSVPKGTALNYVATNQSVSSESVAYTSNLSISTGLVAHDPNRKSVDVEDICAYSAGEPLEYYVSFQNDGETYADHVYVIDKLDANLDVSTFAMGNSSHNCMVTDPTPGNSVAEFDFPAIELPGLNQEIPCQYTYDKTIGEFRFNISTLPNLSPGIIPNAADIDFFVGSVLQTNIAEIVIYENTEDDPCVIPDRQGVNPKGISTDIHILVSPNPFSDNLSISPPSFPVGETAVLEIHDLSGKIMARQLLTDPSALSLLTADWPTGIYLLRLQTANEIAIQRVVKQ